MRPLLVSTKITSLISSCFGLRSLGTCLDRSMRLRAASFARLFPAPDLALSFCSEAPNLGDAVTSLSVEGFKIFDNSVLKFILNYLGSEESLYSARGLYNLKFLWVFIFPFTKLLIPV